MSDIPFGQIPKTHVPTDRLYGHFDGSYSTVISECDMEERTIGETIQAQPGPRRWIITLDERDMISDEGRYVLAQQKISELLDVMQTSPARRYHDLLMEEVGALPVNGLEWDMAAGFAEEPVEVYTARLARAAFDTVASLKPGEAFTIRRNPKSDDKPTFTILNHHTPMVLLGNVTNKLRSKRRYRAAAAYLERVFR